MKPKLERVLSQCIEVGIDIGYSRVHKHNENPSDQAIKDAIADAIEMEIYEWFDFDDLYTPRDMMQ